MKRILLAGLVGVGVAFSGASAFAQIVTGYSLFAPGEGQAQGGSYNYWDESGVQLTDGIKGANDWTADLGNGNAYEWVGWRVADGGASFLFNGGGTTKVSTLTVGLNRAEGSGIYLPSAVNVTFGSSTLSFPILSNAIANGTRFDFVFNVSSLDITGNFSVGLADSNSFNWVFTDEISFGYAPLVSVPGAVPEPSTYAVGGAALLGLLVARRLRRRSLV